MFFPLYDFFSEDMRVSLKFFLFLKYCNCRGSGNNMISVLMIAIIMIMIRKKEVLLTKKKGLDNSG